MDLKELMEQSGQIKERMEQMQQELAKIKVTGEAGGNMVAVTVNGNHQVTKVELSPEFAQEAPEVQESLIQAATNAAFSKLKQELASKQKAILGLPDWLNPPF